MALLQISEPGQSAAPHEHRLAIGIDLGTTNSLVATVRSGMAVVLNDELGRPLLPSVVRYGTDAAAEVGFNAQAHQAADPRNTIVSVKRFMGRGLKDIAHIETLPYDFIEAEGMVKLRTAQGIKSPVEVSADILRALRERAELSLGGQLTGAVITVPAYFDDAQRQATKDAARLAGLDVLRLINEPTAAAVAYGLDRGADGVHAIYDLGGGTFDISILRLNRGVFEVMATGGDSALGGDDFDHAVARWIMQQAGIRDDAGHRQLRRLLRDACAAKEALSARDAADLCIELDDGGRWEGRLDRATFDALVDPLIRKTIAACRRTLRDAGVGPRDVEAVVMVGGSTRVPRVRELVGEFFGAPPLVDIDPDRVVAIGAAIQADVLAGNKSGDDMLLLDVIPLSLGLETMGGLTERLIPRNTTIPVARAQEFTTFKDGQTAIALHVVQGERELVADNRSLARFELRGIPPMVAGAARVRVTYSVDADGLLHVEAEEQASGVRAAVTVKPSYGLTDDEIAGMLRDSMDHARDDMVARQLREEQVEAERVIEALLAALAADGEALLSGDERTPIDAAVGALAAAAQGADSAAIRRARESLEKACETYVERRMNASIRRAMAGHKLEEFE